MSVNISPFGNACIVGYSEDPDGSMRVRIAGNHADLHTHVDDEDAKERVRAAWGHGGHVFTSVPKDALCTCPAPEVTS